MMVEKRKQGQEHTPAGEKSIQEDDSEAAGSQEGKKASENAEKRSAGPAKDEGSDDEELYGLALLLYNTEQTANDREALNNVEEQKQQYHQETGKKQPKDALQDKKNNRNSKCCPSVNRHLVINKSFYFFFSLAVGALLPYLPVFYKQLWLSAQETGILIGIRPLIQLFATPMWGIIADTYKQSKFIFIMSLVAWLVQNYSLSLVSPVFHLGLCKDNATMGIVQGVINQQENISLSHKLNKTHHRTNILPKQSTINSTLIWLKRLDGELAGNASKRVKVEHNIRRVPTRESVHSIKNSFGFKELPRGDNLSTKMPGLNSKRAKVTISNLHRKILSARSKYRSRRKTDLDLLNLIKNSTDANTDIDEIYSEVIKERDEKEFDFLNMVGRYPWPLDTVANYESTQTASDWHNHHNPHLFTTLLVITIIGTLIASPAMTLADTATLQNLGKTPEDYGRQRVWGTFGWGLGAFVVGSSLSTVEEVNSCNNPLNVDYLPSFYAFACLMGIAILLGALFKFDQNHSHDVNVSQGLRSLIDSRYTYFLLTVLFCGSAMGFIETFLFWHLQDLGGTQFLFSTVVLIQCVSEIIVYCFSGNLIQWIGHHQALYLGLLCYVIRFFSYAFITNSWIVLPVEVLHGVSSAAVWSAAVVFVGLIPGAPATMQGILAGLHCGLGHGGGGLVGGLLVSYVGAATSFLIFGVSGAVILCVFVILNSTEYFKCFQWSKDRGTRFEYPLPEDKKEDVKDDYDDLY